jgi:hypothetical protein
MSKELEKPENVESGNDWDDFVSGAAPFWDRWGNTILTAVLVVLVGVFAYRLYSVRQADQLNQAWLELANSTSPQSMSTVATNNKGTPVGWLASIRAGNLYLTQSRQTLAIPTGMPSTTQPSSQSGPAGKELSLSQAAFAFNEVINDPNADLIYKINARLGLAGVEESKGALDKAQALYLDVEKEAKEKYPAIALQAAELAKIAPKLSQKLTYNTDAPAMFGPAQPREELPVVKPEAGKPVSAPAPTTAPNAGNGPLLPSAPAAR